MSSMTLFILIVCIIAVLFLIINFLFAPHIPYQEKYSIFECGFHSFVGQNRIPFDIGFFIFGILYILFEADILLVYPFAVSANINGIYGLTIALIFIFIVTVGFIFELGKGALKIDSRQTIKENNINSINVTTLGRNAGSTYYVLNSSIFC
jgi:NADH-ubiquinone oxidoreductase chain 3